MNLVVEFREPPNPRRVLIARAMEDKRPKELPLPLLPPLPAPLLQLSRPPQASEEVVEVAAEVVVLVFGLRLL